MFLFVLMWKLYLHISGLMRNYARRIINNAITLFMLSEVMFPKMIHTLLLTYFCKQMSITHIKKIAGARIAQNAHIKLIENKKRNHVSKARFAYL